VPLVRRLHEDDVQPPITTDDGTITDVVTQVVCTARTPADGIPVGAFEAFQILVVPLPAKAASLAFPTLQTYSDGKTFSWIQPVTDPANEPDSPVPTLELIAPGGDQTAEAWTPRNLGAGIVIGALGLVTGAVGAVRGRRARS
jgi:hypothetical protein